MKQLYQSLATGTLHLSEIPSPSLGSGQLLIRTTCSLVSAGTERMLVQFGNAGWIDKARQQPDKVQQLIDKVRSDGLISTFEAVQTKLDQPLPLGYCNVGTVVAVGADVLAFHVGDRVASNGPHAELVAVPQNLCAHIPPNVTDESASFTVLASIGLQGIRLAKPTLGETFVVSGLGLIGLLTAQLLVSHGCRVLGLDPDPSKCSLASDLGITSLTLSSGIDPVSWCLQHTDGIGVDGVLITASTSSSEPMHTAAQVCRTRGRIVLVGVTGMDLRRDLLYKKEITLQVSCSYGPGRYDIAYEQQGQDYPIGFVRWTEQRNFQAVLHCLASGTLVTDTLISHRFPIDDAPASYKLLTSSEPSLGILLKYPANADPDKRTISLRPQHCNDSSSTALPCSPLLGVIGAGNYARRTLIPAFAKAGARFSSIAASTGTSPVHVGSKFGFTHATTDVPSLIRGSTCNVVVIATRHDSHASLVQQALAAGKHVFVEKPLCLTTDELRAIEAAYTGEQTLMVGFNRRFAPLLIELHNIQSQFTSPKTFVYTVNAGAIASDHWIQDRAIGGGRFLGEACHFVDLMRHLADSPIENISLHSAADVKSCPDTFSLQLRFVDGSIGTIHYISSGSKSFPKERLEVFAAGKVLRLDNFRKLKAWGIPRFRSRRLLAQDKGQKACCKAFLQSVECGLSSPIPVSQLFEVQHHLLQTLSL